jgi:hypothetical protein
VVVAPRPAVSVVVRGARADRRSEPVHSDRANDGDDQQTVVLVLSRVVLCCCRKRGCVPEESRCRRATAYNASPTRFSASGGTDWLKNTLATGRQPLLQMWRRPRETRQESFKDPAASCASSATTTYLGAWWSTFARRDSQMEFNVKWAFSAWAWFLGTYLAVQFGAAHPSLARTITG